MGQGRQNTIINGSQAGIRTDSKWLEVVKYSEIYKPDCNKHPRYQMDFIAQAQSNVKPGALWNKLRSGVFSDPQPEWRDAGRE